MSSLIFIPFNVPSSKNNKIKTRWGLINSKRVKEYIKETEPYWTDEIIKASFLAMISNLPKPYFIHLTFIRGNKHKFDYINMAQIVKDLMKKYEWIEDDNADEVVTVFGKYSYNKKTPGVIIRVLSKPPQYEFI